MEENNLPSGFLEMMGKVQKQSQKYMFGKSSLPSSQTRAKLRKKRKKKK